jgi:hypothetical protein
MYQAYQGDVPNGEKWLGLVTAKVIGARFGGL